MRYFSLIFALYFLFLAAKPCGDVLDIDNCGQHHTYTHVEQSHHEDGHVDFCSPLCLCSCCGGITLLTEHSVNPLLADPSEYSAIFDQAHPSEVTFSIWQPPKIS